MKIPKFRAWHKEKKIMGNAMWIAFYVNEIAVYEDKLAWPFDEIELMQWTQKIAANGKDIYPNDILTNGFSILLVNNYMELTPTVYNLSWQLGEMQQGFLSELDLSTYSVIGNIREHPELLEKA